MSNQINIFGKITNGKLEFNNKDSVNQWVKMQSEGDDVVVRFTNQKDYATYRQIRLLYKCFRTISEHTGHDVEEIKLILKVKLGLCYSHDVENREITVCKSISDMNRKEISSFILETDKWSTKTLSLPLLLYDDINFLRNIN